MPAFRLPRLKFNLPIVDGKGNPAAYFLRFWNDEVATTIERNETNQNQVIADLSDAFAAIQAISESAQAAQEAANEAQATADTAGGGTAVSGSNTALVIPSAGVAFIAGPQVDLTGVAAGDLTIHGTGPRQDNTLSADENISGDYQVVEIVGMTETVVFTGSYAVYSGSPQTTINTTASAVAAFTSARASTGAVSYRLDINRTDGGPPALVEVNLYLNVRRA